MGPMEAPLPEPAANEPAPGVPPRNGPTILPMFPIGSVLLPTAVLPLHIFEPRYRLMIRHCLDGNRSFGVVLIARGSEVGGGEERTDLGTVAQVVGATELTDGRWYVVALGTQRLRVLRWLADDPYPRAEVVEWSDNPAHQPARAEDYAQLVTDARRLLALAAEAGEQVAEVTTEFADDPALGSFQIAAALPLGAFDRQRVLATDSSAARCALVGRLCAEKAGDLQALLAMGSGEPDAGSGPDPI